MSSDNRNLVLLVADDYETMEQLQQTFVRANFRLLMSTNFEEAISNLQMEMPDIVVCDTDVNGISRESLQHRFPDNLVLQALPFIFLHSGRYNRELNWNLDLDQYLSKPFDPIPLAAFSCWILAYRESMAQFAGTDGLPQVVNRKIFRKEVVRELQRVQRYGGNMSIAIFEITCQSVSQTSSVPVSVSVIFNKIAEALPGLVRTTSFLARMGCRHFAWLMPETDAQSAESAIRRLVADFAKIPAADVLAPLTIHAGLATAPQDGLDYDQLVAFAERKLTEHPVTQYQPV